MINLLIINRIFVLTIDIFGTFLTLLVYLSNRKAKINQLFFLFTTCLIGWFSLSFADIFFQFLPSNIDQFLFSLWLTRISFAFLSLFFVFVYHLSNYFPRKIGENYFLDRIYTTIWIVFFFLTLTPSVIQTIGISESGLYGIGGGLVLTSFMIFAIMSVILVLYNFFKKYRFLTEEERFRFQYFLVGLTIFGIVNVIFVLYAYDLTKGEVVPFNPFGLNLTFTPKKGGLILFGHYSIIFFLGFSAYSIITRRLFGIKVLLTQILVVTMAIILGLLPFIIDVFWQKILLVFIFILFCIFGSLLVQSTKRETKAKEILEVRVQERTKELETAKKALEEAKNILEVKVKARTKELEEAKSILEIKVNARTRELRELALNLEEKVKRRTEELQGRVNELEKFHRLTIGRELKMVELKEEIEKLREELEKSKT